MTNTTNQKDSSAASGCLDKLPFGYLASILPADVNWSDALTPEILAEILWRHDTETLPTSLSREALARWFHEAYERLAPSFGYETRADTKEFDPESKNGKLMIAVCGELLARRATPAPQAATPLPGLDERALFEKSMNDARFFPAELCFARTKSPSGRDEYANSHLQSCWVGWQARVNLTQQAAPEAPARRATW